MNTQILSQIYTIINTDMSLLVTWQKYEATVKTVRNINAEIVVLNYEAIDECGCVEVGMLTAWVPISAT
jgi:hypothetical protein